MIKSAIMLSSNSNSSFDCSADLDVLHEAVALATAGQGLSTGSNRGKGDLHQLIHACKTQQTDTVHRKHRNEPNIRNEYFPLLFSTTTVLSMPLKC